MSHPLSEHQHSRTALDRLHACLRLTHQQITCTARRLRSKREQGGKVGRWWRVLIDHEMHTDMDTSALRAGGTDETERGVSKFGSDGECCQGWAAAVIFHAMLFPMLSSTSPSPSVISHHLLRQSHQCNASPALGFRPPRSVEDGYGCG